MSAKYSLPRRKGFCILLAVCAGPIVAAGPGRIDYGRDVRPIPAEKCFHCHGQDSSKRTANLRLDSFESATAQRPGKPALFPGKPAESAIYLRISSQNAALRMPPAYSNRSLSAEQIEILKRWIEEGGQYSTHWSFVPPSRQQVPQVADRSWVKNPIDAFIRKRLQAEGLMPSPAATAETWLRRASLDLIGRRLRLPN